MAAFEQTGDMLTDIQTAIDNSVVLTVEYTDRKGVSTSRNIAPLEIREDSLYLWSLDKNALRMFKLDGISGYQVTDETFDKNNFQ